MHFFSGWEVLEAGLIFWSGDEYDDSQSLLIRDLGGCMDRRR